MTKLPETKGSPRSLWSLVGGIGASTLLVAAVVGLLIHYDLQNEIVLMLRWLEDQGAWAPVLFIVVMAVVVVFLLPGVLLTTGAGFVFGVTQGTIYVVAGTTLGAMAAFVLARYFFAEKASRYLLRNPRFQMLDDNLPADAWKVVLLTRLIPFFPSKLANYFFGVTSVSLPAFTMGSAIGFIPLSLHNVYLGAIAAELTTEGLRTASLSGGERVIYGVGFVMAVAAVIGLGRWAWRALQSGDADGLEPAGVER